MDRIGEVCASQQADRPNREPSDHLEDSMANAPHAASEIRPPAMVIRFIYAYIVVFDL
jgi:hypothetical protein